MQRVYGSRAMTGNHDLDSVFEKLRLMQRMNNRLAFWRRVALVNFLIVLMLLVTASYAKAHSFYELECCDDRDCEPLAPEQVKTTPEGYVTPDGQVIPFADARISPDRDYHWCKYQRDSTKVIWPMDKKACFYAPMGGM